MCFVYYESASFLANYGLAAVAVFCVYSRCCSSSVALSLNAKVLLVLDRIGLGQFDGTAARKPSTASGAL